MKRKNENWEDFLRHLPPGPPTTPEEREADLKLVAQLIDAGYRSLASKLHPDKGGSRDAMSRLSRVRDQVKRQLGLKAKK
jgi:hypothetical protein